MIISKQEVKDLKTVNISAKNFSATNNGIFEGWGTSLCWYANRIGFSEKLVKDSARLFFSPEGLGLNIMRYNIGGGDAPSHDHIKRTDSEMPGWWKYNEAAKTYIFNTDTDHNQLRVLSASYKSAGKDAYVEAFSNSPPFYMTKSGCSSGNHNPAQDNIKEEAIDDFGKYLSAVCKHITENLGIRIKSLAPMNEPFSNYWRYHSEKQEGCFVSPGKIQSNVIISTSNALKNDGLDEIIVTASDETNTVTQYISTKMMSEDALSRVKRISTHTYAKASPLVSALARELNKNIWMSETDWSGVSGEDSGEMGPALWLAEKIIEDINTLSPSAFVIWQIIAAYISKIPDRKGRLDMPCVPDLTHGFWGTAFADIDNEEIYLTQKYYAFGQFSRYIRPGMTIINTEDVGTLAAYDKETGKTVIVAVNTDITDKETEFAIDDINVRRNFAEVIRTSGTISNGEHWENIGSLSLSENRLKAVLKKHSITTFII